MMNKPPRIMSIVGARPQFVKAAAVSRAFLETSGVVETLVHTGQHFDDAMSAVFFSELAIPTPAYNLDIHGGGHGEMTGRMLEGLERIMLNERPDAVLVYGDTNSTLAGALAAVKLHVPVAHVEAGLRSFNLAMPEEVNRILTDRISRWLFTPTDAAAAHLAREGVPAAQVVPSLLGGLKKNPWLRVSPCIAFGRTSPSTRYARSRSATVAMWRSCPSVPTTSASRPSGSMRSTPCGSSRATVSPCSRIGCA